MKKIFFYAALVSGAISWAQLSDEVNSTSIDNRIDKTVKDFIQKQQINNQVKKIQKNTDIIGRRGNDAKKELHYDIKEADVKKMKVVFTENSTSDEFSSIYKRVESMGPNGVSYEIDQKKISKNDFFEKSLKHYRKHLSNTNRPQKIRVSNLTAKQIVDELNNNPNLKASVYEESNVNDIHDSDSSKYLLDYQIRNKSRITSNALNKGYKGQGISIYFIECSRPNGNYDGQNFYKWIGDKDKDGFCSGSNLPDHARNVVRLLHATAPEAMIYGGTSYPTIEQIEKYGINIITESVERSKTKSYSTYDYKADSVVYNYKLPYFVAAGNSGFSSTVGSPAKGFNTIAVAAADPKTNEVKSYSNTKNGYFGNDKPEIINYTNFRYSNKETFNGTSAAAPYTAAMAADLMSMLPFLKHEPAALKAAMIALSTGNASNTNYDVDNSNYFNAKIPLFPSEPLYAAFSEWDGNNSDFFGEYTTIKEKNFKSGKRYRIAIAWFTSGKYLLNAGNAGNYHIAQDYDLYVKQGSKIIAKSTSYNNPFEVVDFTAPNNNEFTIEIRRSTNLDKTEKRILGYSWYEVQ